MGKNYIEEFLKLEGVKVNERFNLKGYPFNPCVVNDEYELINEHKCKDSTAMCDLIAGGFEIEKIKPKTLLEQLKEQGFGWMIGVTGKIHRRENISSFHYEKWVKQGNVFLTESEAEREVYRRKLEFEMQEWARENDVLGEQGRDMPPFDCFNFCIKQEVGRHTLDVVKEVFDEKTRKYYNWEE